jgi:iron complex outermembrane receptor protein
VQNLADRRPSWDSATLFFDFTQADPRGRTGAVRLSHQF